MSEIITINEQFYPIVTISTTNIYFDEEMINDYLNQMIEYYKNNQGKNIVIIYEISIIKAIDAKARIKIGEWLKANSEIINNAVAGVCYVQKNILQKIILDGIFTVKSPDWEHKVVTSLEEGILWGKEILKKKGKNLT